MPEGTQLTQGVIPMLTSVAINYLPQLTQYIAKKVFPNVPTGATAGLYPIWIQDDFLRIQAKKISNREASPEVDFATSKGNYSVSTYGAAASWTDRELGEAREGGMFSADFVNNKVKLATFNGLLALEQQTSSLIQNSANWTTAIAGVGSSPTSGQTLQWDNVGSDPVQTIVAAKRAMHILTGFMPNTIIIPGIVMDKLKLNPSLIDRIKFTGTPGAPSQVTMQMIAALFEIDNILVPEGVYNAAPEGETKNIQYFWGKNVWLGYVAPSPSRDTPSAGYHFSWTGNTAQGLPAGMDITGAGPQMMNSVLSPEGLFVSRYDTVRPAKHWVDAQLFTSPNITAPDLGGLITSIIQ